MEADVDPIRTETEVTKFGTSDTRAGSMVERIDPLRSLA